MWYEKRMTREDGELKEWMEGEMDRRREMGREKGEKYFVKKAERWRES